MDQTRVEVELKKGNVDFKGKVEGSEDFVKEILTDWHQFLNVDVEEKAQPQPKRVSYGEKNVQTQAQSKVAPDSIVKDNIERFKCWYECPECGQKGYRYVIPHLGKVQCTNCGHKMPTREVGHTKLDHDDMGNHYVAGRGKPFYTGDGGR